MDLGVLPLNDYDVVLGTTWPKKLGTILWNFKELKMSFSWHNQHMVLTGIVSPSTSLVSGKQFFRAINDHGVAALIHIVDSSSNSGKHKLSNQQEKELQILLKSFEPMFEEGYHLTAEYLRRNKLIYKIASPKGTLSEG